MPPTVSAEYVRIDLRHRILHRNLSQHLCQCRNRFFGSPLTAQEVRVLYRATRASYFRPVTMLVFAPAKETA